MNQRWATMAMPQRGDPPTPRLPSSLKLPPTLKLPPPRFALGRSRRRTSRRTSMILLRACELPPSPSLPPSHLHAPPSYTYCNMCRTVCGWGTTKRKAWYNTPMNSKDEIQERMADDVCITVSPWRRFRRRKENNADANFKCT